MTEKLLTPWFRHDVDAATDEKLVALKMAVNGPGGYALYFQALERMYRQAAPVSLKESYELAVFADRLGMSPDEVVRTVELAVENRLFVEENWVKNRCLWSERAQKDMRRIIENRRRDAERKSVAVKAEFDQRAEFERLWLQYPRKDKKAQSFVHFRDQIRTLADLAKVEKALKTYNEIIQREGRQSKYILMGSTFFCSRWPDFVDRDVKAPVQEGALSRQLREARERGA